MTTDEGRTMVGIGRRTVLGAAAAATGLAIAGTGAGARAGTTSATQGRRDHEDEVWPAIVVGSGYGGAVSALHLTRRGIPTLMLEMGKEWPRPTRPFFPVLTPGKSSLWLKRETILPFGPVLPVADYYTGVLDRLEFAHMKVYCGRGVGGSSLVNGAIALEPRRAFLREMMPMLDLKQMFGTYYPRARRNLHVNRIDADFYRTTPWYEFARTASRQARRAGYQPKRVSSVYDFDFLMKEATVPGHPRSALAGQVILGNNYGKRSVDTSYIRRACRTGNLTVKSLRQVVDVERLRNGMFRLTVNTLNTSGKVVDTMTYRTKRLFLNGGTMGTTELLLRSQANGSLDLPDSVGEGWGNNGNIQSGRLIDADTGTEQSTMVVEVIDDWDNRKHRIVGEIAPLPTGTETRTSLYLGVTDNPNRGRLTWNRRTNSMELDWKPKDAKPSIAAMRSMIDRLNSADGGTYDYELFPTGFGSDFTYHPLGGCLLGEVTDNYGRVHGNPGLYVMDGSLVHGALGANPLLTITALAERNMDQIMATDLK